MSKDTSAQSNVIVSLSSSEQYRARMFGDARRCACNNHGECAKGDACYYKKAKAALIRAHEIRQFEIELLWKRTAYVATFQTFLFAALGVSFSAESPESTVYILRFIVCVVGMFSAFFWYLINNGSKFWHENWEKHIDFLEYEFEGKLHETILHNKGRNSYSVSRSNIYISLMFLVTWWILAAILLCDSIERIYCVALCSFANEIYYFILISFFMFIPIIFLLLCCRLKTQFRGADVKVFFAKQELPEQINESPLK